MSVRIGARGIQLVAACLMFVVALLLIDVPRAHADFTCLTVDSTGACPQPFYYLGPSSQTVPGETVGGFVVGGQTLGGGSIGGQTVGGAMVITSPVSICYLLGCVNAGQPLLTVPLPSETVPTERVPLVAVPAVPVPAETTPTVTTPSVLLPNEWFVYLDGCQIATVWLKYQAAPGVFLDPNYQNCL